MEAHGSVLPSVMLRVGLSRNNLPHIKESVSNVRRQTNAHVNYTLPSIRAVGLESVVMVNMHHHESRSGL